MYSSGLSWHDPKSPMARAKSASGIDSFTLARLMPEAVGWAECMERHVLANGTPLNAEGLELAKRVNVAVPQRVRILVVQQMPMPGGRALRELATRSGLLNPGVVGLHFGYGIVIRRGHDHSARVLSHELRHVHQFEREGGSIAIVIPKHLRDVHRYGPVNAPHEVDARAHEIATI